MIDWLKDLVRPIRRTDPQFGRMRYLRDTCTWEGWTSFAPTGGQVEVLLSGDRTGPSEQQRQFVRTLETRYASIFPAVRSSLIEAVGPEAGISGLPVEFTLVAIDLPAELTDATTWELCYETEPKARFLAVEMKAWQPTNVSVDC